MLMSNALIWSIPFFLIRMLFLPIRIIPAAWQGAYKSLLRLSNVKMGCRLGLLHPEQPKLLIFEVESAKLKCDEVSCSRTTTYRNIWRPKD